MQVLLFMHRLKTNSFSRIFLHQSRTINHKYVTLYSKTISNSQRDTQIMPNIALRLVVWLCVTAFYVELKRTYYRSSSLNLQSKKRYLNLKKNWAFLKTLIQNETTLKNKAAWWKISSVSLVFVITVGTV